MNTRIVRTLGSALLAPILATTLALSPARADPFPPLTAPAAPSLPGKMVFAELVTPDLAAAENFYGGLLGWTFRDVPVQDTRYAEALLDGRNVAGLVERPLPPGSGRHPAWLTFLSTSDVAATVERARARGARILYPATDHPGFGQEAVLADPGDAVFAVIASASGDPPDQLVAVGDWIWSALLTPSADAEAAFYQDILGYQIYPDAPGHMILAAGGYARFAIAPLPPTAHSARSRWINLVRVADVDASAALAARLGGRVLVPPHTDRNGQQVALLADPQGAVFGIMQWIDAGQGAPP